MIIWSTARCMKVEYSATTGFLPPDERPAAMPTACSSAMPTSTKREGNSAAKVFSPVPPVMAAVMATTSASLAASSASAAPNTSV